MSNLVIVAIPDENDRVWKVSSEKIPHLTLLFLGDVDQVSNLDQIMQFVEHAANTTLRRFYLPVDRRGELGADKADVLFFKKGRYDYKAIRDFRATLLQDSNIKTAYDSAEQFEGPWQPHLTLGYPETPANKIPDDQISSFYDVQFNKIAVWTGDFEGPEFLLKDYWDEYDALETVPMDVAMSDIRERKDEVLTHFGVKGMKWGVHTDRHGRDRFDPEGHDSGADVAKLLLLPLPTNIPAAVRVGKRYGEHRADRKWEKSFQGNKKFIEVHNQTADHMDGFLKTHNADPRWKDKDGNDLDLNKHPDKLKEYDDGYFKEYEKAYGQATEKVYGSSPSGKMKITYDEPTGYVKLSRNTAKHANTEDAPPETVEFQVIRDVDGYIVDLIPIAGDSVGSGSMAQTIDLGAEFLAHYGIKGMHWGQRKSPPAAVPASATSHVPQSARRKTKIKTEGGENHPAHEDAIKVARAQVKLKKSGPAALSNQELQEVANRLNLERNVTQLVSSKTRVGKGRQFVRGVTGVNREFNDTVGTGLQTKRLAGQLR